MRIAIFTDSFLPQVNGVVTGTMNLVESLPKHEFLIVAPNAGKISWKPKNCKLVLVGPSIPLPTYKDYRVCFFLSRKARKQIEEFNPDIVVSHTPFFIGEKGLDFAKKHGIPIIGTYNTLLPDFLMYLPLPWVKNTDFAKNIAWKFGNNFYKKCGIVVSPSNAMINALKEHGLRHERMLKIPFGVNENFFNAGKKAVKSKSEFRIVYLGRLSFEKNIEVILNAFALLAGKFPELRLVLIGNGPALRPLRHLAKTLGILEKTEFTGALFGKELAEKLASCNLYVSASTVETQGIVHFESMAAGLPAIVSDSMANPEAIKEGINGFLFEPFNERELAEKIRKIANSRSLQEKLSKNALKFAEDYHWKEIAKEFEKLFKEAIVLRKE